MGEAERGSMRCLFLAVALAAVVAFGRDEVHGQDQDRVVRLDDADDLATTRAWLGEAKKKPLAAVKKAPTAVKKAVGGAAHKKTKVAVKKHPVKKAPAAKKKAPTAFVASAVADAKKKAPAAVKKAAPTKKHLTPAQAAKRKKEALAAIDKEEKVVLGNKKYPSAPTGWIPPQDPVSKVSNKGSKTSNIKWVYKHHAKLPKANYQNWKNALKAAHQDKDWAKAVSHAKETRWHASVNAASNTELKKVAEKQLNKGGLPAKVDRGTSTTSTHHKLPQHKPLPVSGNFAKWTKKKKTTSIAKKLAKDDKNLASTATIREAQEEKQNQKLEAELEAAKFRDNEDRAEEQMKLERVSRRADKEYGAVEKDSSKVIQDKDKLAQRKMMVGV